MRAYFTSRDNKKFVDIKIEKSIMSVRVAKNIKNFLLEEREFGKNAFYKKSLKDMADILQGKIEKGIIFFDENDDISNEDFVVALTNILSSIYHASLEQLKTPTSNKQFVESRLDCPIAAQEYITILEQIYLGK